MSTIFSKIISGEIPCYKVAENDKYFAFLDISPVAKGHTLVVPKREVDYIFDQTDKEVSEHFLFAKQVATAIKKVISCNRIGVCVMGLEVPHAHIHLIPISSERDMDFHKEHLQLSSVEMKEIASLIKEAFDELF